MLIKRKLENSQNLNLEKPKFFCYGNSRFATCPPYWIFHIFFGKIAANYFELNRKHVFIGSKINMFKSKSEIWEIILMPEVE